MSELPPTWAEVQLSSITGDASQRVPLAQEAIRYIDIGSVNRNTKSIEFPQELLGKDAPSRARKQVAVGDTLVSMTRPNLNAVAMVPKELDGQFASTGFDVLRPVAGVDPRWIGYLVRTEAFVEAMSDLVQGALYPAVRSKDVRAHVVPLAPQTEQTRIANQLDTLLTRVQACNDRFDAISALLKRFRQTVLDAATTGVLTEEWRENHCLKDGSALSELVELERSKRGSLKVRGESAKVDTELLFELPPSWSWVANHRLAQDDSNAICAGPFGTIFKAKDFRSSGVPIIFLRHVGHSKFLTHKPGFMDEKVWKDFHQPYSVFGGELLVTKLGDPPGTACIYPVANGTAMVTPDVMKMSVNAAAAETKYLMYFFNAPTSKKIVEALCFGVTRLRIDLSMFKTFPIPLPPRDEQTEIVRRVEALFALVDRIEARCTDARAQTQRLTPLVLAKAFRGELVPQDPNDEPASALLARIGSSNTAVVGENNKKVPVAIMERAQADINL